MLNADRYRLQLLFTYLFICYNYLFIPFSRSLPQFVLGLSPIIFQICINPFTTSRIAFIHHLVKQINYCYILLSDIVHVMLYTVQ